MGRSPCCDEVGVKKGPWTPEEDKKLVDYIQKNGHGSWRNLPKSAGLNRCGKSCRLRWTNYLRPDIKRGKFSDEEERLIIHLHSVLGNKWSAIATRLPGRTDNEIKNYWNTHLRKKLLLMGIDPVTHRRRTDLDLLASLPSLLATANLGNLPASWDNALRMQADAANTARLQIIQTLVRAMNLDTMNLLGSATFGNYQYNDMVQLSRQLEGIANGSLTLPQDVMQTDMVLPNMNSLQLPANFHGFSESSHPLEERELIASRLDGSCSSEIIQEFKDGFTNQLNQTGNFLVPLTANSTPPLVSAENVTRDDHVPERPISPNSSSSIQFNAWEGQEVGDLDADGWKDVLDQIYWSSAP